MISYLYLVYYLYSHIKIVVLRDKMNCTVGFVSCFLCIPLASFGKNGTRQQGWYISGTLRKQFPNLTVQFILSLSM